MQEWPPFVLPSDVLKHICPTVLTRENSFEHNVLQSPIAAKPRVLIPEGSVEPEGLARRLSPVQLGSRQCLALKPNACMHDSPVTVTTGVSAKEKVCHNNNGQRCKFELLNFLHLLVSITTSNSRLLKQNQLFLRHRRFRRPAPFTEVKN